MQRLPQELADVTRHPRQPPAALPTAGDLVDDDSLRCDRTSSQGQRRQRRRPARRRLHCRSRRLTTRAGERHQRTRHGRRARGCRRRCCVDRGLVLLDHPGAPEAEPPEQHLLLDGDLGDGAPLQVPAPQVLFGLELLLGRNGAGAGGLRFGQRLDEGFGFGLLFGGEAPFSFASSARRTRKAPTETTTWSPVCWLRFAKNFSASAG